MIAIVTGAEGDIGKAIVAALRNDYEVVIGADIAVTTEINEFLVYLDVTDEKSWNCVVDKVIKSYDNIDLLVNNAGALGTNSNFWDMPMDEWRRIIDVNLFGTIMGCNAVAPAMRRQGRGRIINMASVAGKEGTPGIAAYSTAKAGVIGLTKAIAREVASDGILVNCVCPAVIDSRMIECLSEETRRYMVDRIPLGRPGKPEEVAALVRWLGSEHCTFATGATFDVSGGRASY